MTTITLRKALQSKKTLVGDIAKMKSTIEKFNSQETPNKHIKLAEIHTAYIAKIDELIALKTAITKANVEIYGAIVAADEIKGLISMYEGLNTSDSTMKRGPDGQYSTVLLTVYFDYSMVEDKVTELKEKLQGLLDKIDYFNSNTTITIG